MVHTLRVLGVDTSLRSTGVGVVAAKGSSLSLVSCGVIKNAPKLKHSTCLSNILSGIQDLLREAEPDAVAVEGAFFAKNAKTAMVLGQARGVVLAACSAGGIPVYEYSPRKVKQATVGFGGASKDQVAKMVVRLLSLKEEPPEDATDALAIAICHVHSLTGHAALDAEEI
ncbi:MAG: crossover junction endodeoxyribonuclease RuvC [Verrucomicrobia bacterium]|nr:crossover junction endodeoxyribonuclease RuvC [Verrucomicrobiota bacterium]